jgi:hypothetical protein
MEEENVQKTEEKEGWRTPDQSWLEMEAADDGEIFFISLFLAFEEKQPVVRLPQKEQPVVGLPKKSSQSST